MTHEIPRKRLEWLRGEVAAWQRDGLVEADSAAAIVDRYRPSGRTTVVRLVVALGAAFVAAGLISLVASNIDELSPMVRFAGIAAVWLGALIAAEVLRRRDPDADASDRAGHGSVTVGAARVVAVAAYGATVFQAAQSLQVPAYSSVLLGCWATGALAYAYACRGVGPLVVGVASGVGWFGWATGERTGTAAAVVLSLLAAAAVTTALGGLHERGPLPHFSAPWSYAGALLTLVGLFIAALPDVGEEELRLSRWSVGLVVAVATALGVAARGSTQVRREAAATICVLAAGLLLLAWTPADVDFDDTLSGAELLRAVVGTALYLATAIWVAVVGAVRDRPQLTNLATAALVVFVTVQSFGVFAPLLSGAALFLVLGVVLIGGGVAADRARRRLVAEVAE